MRKIIIVLMIMPLLFLLTGCDLLNGNKTDVVNLGDGDKAVKWNLVVNNNECRPVESAHFEFSKDNFKYYENGELKKEGTHRITYFGVENTISPLHLNLNFGKDNDGLLIYDYIDCYTEDSKEELHQFTIINECYHIKPIRSGGVPVRDYHLSDMPYALGTYVKEGTDHYSYKNGKVNYLNCARLDGKFYDENDNMFYFVNNSYSSNYPSSDYSSYTVYMRYENKMNNTFLEGTIMLSWYEDFYTGERHDIAHIYVMHGDSEPGEESGTYALADYELMDFNFNGENSFTFASGDYAYDNYECNFDPANFISGTYRKDASK